MVRRSLDYCICEARRYNNYSEAMFWACFMYDHKGPCHIYYPETEEQKIEYMKTVQMLNEQEIEDECWLDYERQEQEKERI